VIARHILHAELASLALDTVHLDGYGALDTALPRYLALRLCAALSSRGVEASWAPDHDDRELAWVYVTVEGEPR
jgi:hypothetical protein